MQGGFKYSSEDVEDIGKLLSSSLLNDNNFKGKNVQKDDKMKNKDISPITTTTNENLVLHDKMLECKGKSKDLRSQLDRLMKQHEETNPSQRVDRIIYRQAQLETNKFQQEVEMLKLDRNYHCHLGHTMI